MGGAHSVAKAAQHTAKNAHRTARKRNAWRIAYRGVNGRLWAAVAAE
jgi:hypothetical protein